MLSYQTAGAQEGAWEKAVWYGCLTAMIAVLVYLARDLDWHVLWRYRTFLLKGLLTTVMLTVVSISLGMLVAIILAAARLYAPRWLRYAAVAIIEIIRAIPHSSFCSGCSS